MKNVKHGVDYFKHILAINIPKVVKNNYSKKLSSMVSTPDRFGIKRNESIQYYLDILDLNRLRCKYRNISIGEVFYSEEYDCHYVNCTDIQGNEIVVPLRRWVNDRFKTRYILRPGLPVVELFNKEDLDLYLKIKGYVKLQSSKISLIDNSLVIYFLNRNGKVNKVSVTSVLSTLNNYNLKM